MYRGETMAGVIADESRHDPSRGFAGGYYLETLSLGVPFLAASSSPARGARSSPRCMDAYANTAGMWIVGEDMPQETNRVTLNCGGHRPARPAGGRTCTSTTTRTTSPCATTRSAQGEAVYEAVGAVGAHRTPPYPSTHNLGTAG